MMIVAPRDVMMLPGYLHSRKIEPHGLLLARSYLSMSRKGLALENQIHFNSLIPSDTGNIIAALSIVVNIEIKELTDKSDGQSGWGLSLRVA
jgi:hypothetical protein